MKNTEEKLIERINRLERHNRRVMGLGGVLLAAVIGMGLAPAQEGGRERAGDEAIDLNGVSIKDGMITATFIKIVDDFGRSRIEFGADPDDTQRRSKSFGMVMRDPGGAERFGLGITEEDAVTMGFDAAPGVGAPMRDRLALSVGADGAAAVMLIDNKTSMPVRLFTDADGGGGLEFIGYDAEAKIFNIKRTDFEGITEYQVSNSGK